MHLEQDIQNPISEDLGYSVILWMKQQVMEMRQVKSILSLESHD